MELQIGTICEGKVTAITKYGAFVALPEGKTGMVHISEIAHTYVSDIRQHLEEGQEVKVKIIGIDQEGKISLSIKKTTAPPERKPFPISAGNNSRRQTSQREATPITFEDKLKQFMQDSESRMSDLKQHIDKRSGSSRRSKSK